MAFDWRNVRVAVLGGGGFVGSHLVDLLSERGSKPAVPRTADGWDFRRLDKAQDFFKQTRPDIVFNCAARQGGLAYQSQCPAEIFYDNMLLGLNSLHAAHLAGVQKYVNVVAACSYPGYLPGMLSEADYWAGPLHDTVVNYGFAKKAQVVQGACYRRQYGFRSVHLLMTNLYGPREHFHPDRSHGLAAILRKVYEAKRDGRPEVVLWGTGKPIREWLYVRDAAEALLLAAESYDDAEPLNVSVGSGVSILELAQLIQEVVGYKGKLTTDPVKPDGALVKTFANERIRQLLGWKPRTPLADGIRATLRWFTENYEKAIGH